MEDLFPFHWILMGVAGWQFIVSLQIYVGFLFYRDSTRLVRDLIRKLGSILRVVFVFRDGLV